MTAELETQVRNLQRELAANNVPAPPLPPVEPTVLKSDYDKLDQELRATRKRLDDTTADVNKNLVKETETCTFL